ncbi:hypothetical protein [Gelria sp. Kuro-4]|uniref:hypothetical protein n=1 Tax=Gelria sp. Kuro-4 TaxID=2796927 RepID=UPI001C7F4A78|nr:hypothetical protein [Gelria sp. Kuro-4]
MWQVLMKGLGREAQEPPDIQIEGDRTVPGTWKGVEEGPCRCGGGLQYSRADVVGDLRKEREYLLGAEE